MRLIDTEWLKNLRLNFKSENQSFVNGWNSAIDTAYKSAPTIEAEPVKHGIWQFQYEDITTDEPIYECSVCGGTYPKYNYCPNCGAAMNRGVTE